MSRDPWQALLLLGADRAPSSPPPAPHAALDAAWRQLDWSRREIAMLHAAALVAVARRAGAVPVRDAEGPAPCPPDAQPVLPAPAAERLRRMLAGEHAQCLREGLRLAHARGWRSAARDLPALLARGHQEPSLRAAIGPVLGERGRWLARQAPEWQWALGTTTVVADERWTTGTPTERVAWLRQRHAADPDAAVRALAATWGEESGDQRELLLAAIVSPPHAAAADWLQRTALRDRRGSVRLLARTALLRLPDSALAVRARQRATALLQVDGLLKKRLVVSMPATFDPAWQADGIDEKPPSGVGPRAHWTRQLLGMVPLQHWLATLRCQPDQLFQWNRDEDSRDTLRLAFLDAAQLDPSPELAAALTRAQLLGDQWPKAAGDRLAFVRDWITALSPAAADAVHGELAARFPADELFGELLVRTGPIATSDPFHLADGMLQWLQRGRLVRDQATALAAAAPVAAIPRLLQAIAALPDLPSATEAFAHVLEFRQSLHLAFAGRTTP